MAGERVAWRRHCSLALVLDVGTAPVLRQLASEQPLPVSELGEMVKPLHWSPDSGRKPTPTLLLQCACQVHRYDL